MALIAISVYNTLVNNRKWMLEKTLESVEKTVDFSRHRVFVIDNNSEKETQTDAVYDTFSSKFPFTLIRMENNVGTAKAINAAWAHRKPEEHAIKLDSDVVIHETEWADRLEDCVNRDPTMGICGLKRIDCIEKPDRTDWYKSELYMLPQIPPQRWLVVEKANHIIGTALLHSNLLLNKIGYLYQMGLSWGFDDSLMAARCKAAGFYSCFYPHIKLDHIDPGDTDYHKQKEASVGKMFDVYHRYVKEYLTGQRPLYHGPSD